MKKLKVLELYAGTRSIGKEFEKLGHEVYSIELDEQFENIDWYADITKITKDDIFKRFGKPDIVWASPPCQKFSVSSIGKHWIKGTNDPKTDEAKEALNLLEKTLELIKDLDPLYYFIENPRGKMRKVDLMKHLPRHTVTYCQYGDIRMKPTDIWTNHPNPRFKPMCKNGDSCHVSAPRGSRTGTQGMKNSREKAVIPSELGKHIAIISQDEKTYRLIDWQDEEDIIESQTKSMIIEFLNNVWEEEDLSFNGLDIEVLKQALEGIDYYIEEEASSLRIGGKDD